MNKYCVYAHIVDGVVRYIGEGTIKRAHTATRANHSNWNDFFKDKEFSVEILSKDLTKKEASILELEYILKYSDTIINKKKHQIRPLELCYDKISSSIYYDETSPTFIRWVNGNKKFKAGDIAGYFTKASGYGDVTINNVAYRIHRLIWVLFNKELSPDYMIDHINGNVKDNRISNLRKVTALENNRNKVLTSASTGLHNIRESCAKSGISAFEVVWTVNEKRNQTTFNIKKLGSISAALKEAYDFRQSLIQDGFLSPRIVEDEPNLEDVISRFENKATSYCSYKLSKSGLRFVDYKIYKGKLYSLTVRFKSAGVTTSKMFLVKDDICGAFAEMYCFRESLINNGIIDPSVKKIELSYESALSKLMEIGRYE